MCRDFFAHEGGRNTVEFFKETQTGDGLFVALKFESRSIAKEVLSRLQQVLFYYSNCEVSVCVVVVYVKFLMHALLSYIYF